MGARDLTEHFGTCPACWTDGLFPVTETDADSVRLECAPPAGCGHPFWITIHNPQEEP